MAGIFEPTQGTMLRIPDYSDRITSITSVKTPFLRLLKRGAPLATTRHSWNVEVYPVEAASASVDGADTSSFTYMPRYPCETFIQWVKSNGWQVGTIAQASATAGVAKNREKPNQILKDGIRFNLMLERLLLSTQTHQAESGLNPYKLEGALGYLDATSASPLPSQAKIDAGAKFTGALSTFTPSALETMMVSAARVKREPVDWTGIVGDRIQRSMSMWAQKVVDATANTTYFPHLNMDQQDAKLVQVVNFFKFDQGTCRTLPSYYVGCDLTSGEPTAYSPRSGIFVDLNQWETRWQVPTTPREFPDLGGGPRGDTQAVLMLVCMSAAAQGLVYTQTD